MSLTKGQVRIGKYPNLAHIKAVDELEQKAAELVDLMNAIPSDSHSNLGNERGRLKSLAMTQVELGVAMALKAATKTE